MTVHNLGPWVHVLHVDDEPDYGSLVQDAARSANSSLVVHCQDGYLSALAYLSGWGAFVDRQQYPLPAFVLLDYVLNGRTGVDLIRWLRAHREFRTLPVVMYSGLDTVEQVALCYREGANHFLRKASSLARLKRLVEIFAQCFRSDPPAYDLLLAQQEYRPPPPLPPLGVSAFSRLDGGRGFAAKNWAGTGLGQEDRGTRTPVPCPR
jgi:DNA-binding response OmpR family regulator